MNTVPVQVMRERLLVLVLHNIVFQCYSEDVVIGVVRDVSGMKCVIFVGVGNHRNAKNGMLELDISDIAEIADKGLSDNNQLVA